MGFTLGALDPSVRGRQKTSAYWRPSARVSTSTITTVYTRHWIRCHRASLNGNAHNNPASIVSWELSAVGARTPNLGIRLRLPLSEALGHVGRDRSPYERVQGHSCLTM